MGTRFLVEMRGANESTDLIFIEAETLPLVQLDVKNRLLRREADDAIIYTPTRILTAGMAVTISDMNGRVDK